MPETCNVVGTVVSPDHIPLARALVEFQLIPQLVQPSRNGVDTLAPKVVGEWSDAVGAITVRLEPAFYQVTITGANGRRYPPYRVAVPDQETANLADIQTLPPPEPVYLDEIRQALTQTGLNAAAAVQAAAEAQSVLEQFPAGIPGDEGPPGPSAYDEAVEAGFVGTPEEWLASLEGNPGGKGDDGDSAYQVAVAAGFVGTPTEWLASLQGADGRNFAYLGNSYELTNGQQLTTFDTFTHPFNVGGLTIVTLLKPKQDRAFSAAELADVQLAISLYDILVSTQNGTKGDAGDAGASAYQVAVANGFTGDATAWLASLVGASGASAYQVAVANGFVGTQAAWLASLQGQSMTITTTTTQAAFDAAVATPTNLVVRIF
jgi:hypothetical protein